MRERLERELHGDFNSVLANLYRDGADRLGFHRDSEPELGPEPLIASVSLGATRRFRFRAREGAGSFGLDLTDLSRERWSLSPRLGDMVTEIQTSKSHLTYMRSVADPPLASSRNSHVPALV